MAGIDNITNEILRGAESKVNSILDEARGKAEALLSDTEKQCEADSRKKLAKAEEDAKNYAARIESQAGLRSRQTILTAKQGIIEQVISAAQEKLKGQPAGEYFAMLLTLIEKRVRGGDGEILLSKKDLERLPSDFAEKAAAFAKKEGGTLKVSEAPSEIEDGFILRYGGIEENCTLASLFAEKSDALKDIVHGVLW